jgi:hypothetical protein
MHMECVLRWSQEIDNGSLVAYSYKASRVGLPPGTRASYSDSSTSSALELRCFQMVREVAFSRIVVEIKVGF